MKLTNNAKAQLKPGMTLIELTVVIIVLLTLISVLFFAGTAYIKSSNRTGCLANQSNIQKGIRGYQNITNQNTGAAISLDDIVGADLLPGVPAAGGASATLGLDCPTAGVDYQIAATYTVTGGKMVFCLDPDFGDATVYVAGSGGNPGASQVVGDADHAPTSTSAW